MELPTRPRTTKPNGRQPHHALSPAFVRAGVQAGRYCDRDGLYLDVQLSGTRSWVQRLVIRGRRRELGLGGFPLAPLKEARVGGNPLVFSSVLGGHSKSRCVLALKGGCKH